MSWENILKLDEYTEEKLNEYRERLKRSEDPEEIKMLERLIKFWEAVSRGG